MHAALSLLCSEPEQGGEPVDAQFDAAYRASLSLTRRMQRSTDPVIPARVMARLVGSICLNHAGKTVAMTPAALRAIDELVETNLVRLLDDAVLVALHAAHRVVQPRDIQLSRRLRGDRA